MKQRGGILNITFSVFLVLVSVSRGQLKSDEMRVAKTLRGVAAETAAHVDAASVELHFNPGEVHPTVRQVFATAFSERNIRIYTDRHPAADLVFIDVRELVAVKTPAGRNLTRREIRWDIGISIESRGKKMILWSRSFAGSAVDSLKEVAETGLHDFRTEEDEPFLLALLEPVLVAAAAVIVVVLLFTVRGS